MSRKNILLLVVILSFTWAKAEEKYYYPDHEFDETPLGDSIDRASMSFLKEAYESAQDKNLVASPLAVFSLLSLYAGGSGPNSEEQIVRVLGAGNYSQLSSSYRDLHSKLSSIDPDSFTLANKIYLAQQYTLEPLFGFLVRSRGEVEKTSFRNPKAATANINRWGEEKTRGHIKNPLPDGVITEDTALALLNVIFFQGQWAVPFHSNETKDEDFHLDKTTTIKKPTMHLLKPLFYYESKDLGSRLIELPYQQSGFRMVVVIPDELEDLPSVIEKLQSKGILSEVFQMRPPNADIDLYMPKFQIESNHDLKELLPKMGIDKMFTESAEGIVVEDNVVVSEAFQKAFVKMDEEGATAGAFTGMKFIRKSYPPRIPKPIEVRVDHPFLYMICYEDKILFVGTVTH